MKEVKILVTGIGRRIELMQAFRQAALKLDVSLIIYGADMAGNAPALAYCDYVRKVCSMKDPLYISELLKICREDGIDLVIPTIDTDLLVLSENVEKFEEIRVKVLISKKDKILICRDKNYTGNFFESCGLKAPRTYSNYLEYDGPYPCFIKPKDGSSSINAFKVDDFQKLEVYAKQIDDYIVQPFISGKEYTIDVFCDFDGNPIFITPRERLQVRAGEVLKTRICMDQVMIDEAKIICEKFKPCGPLTVQLIQDEKTGDNYYIEINPRFGGGSPLSMKAGARSAEALIKLMKNEAIDTKEVHICDGAVYSRFDQSVCVSEGNFSSTIKGVIFDLDDTLYSEKQYIKSGYKKIAEYLGKPEAAEMLWAYFEKGVPAIDVYLTEIGEINKKEACVKIYREQNPDIHLYDSVIELINDLREKHIKIGIITDGRPEGQKAKLKALGLYELVDDVIITDELGGIQFRKPCDIAYRIMCTKWKLPYEEVIYIGDNMKKDFQACKQLGMHWKCFENVDGIYYTSKECCDNKIFNLRDFMTK
ncbi:MAG: HAD-IA family hydrolase [Erysipelotrichaceae bacterium]|nr:HAD-IA family hydrolase [Erysipelotrichaceae bacterium]